MGTVFQHRSPSLFLTPGLAGNQAPSFRAAHYITPARRSQATSTMAAPSPPVHDPITTADRSTPELPQPSHLATIEQATHLRCHLAAARLHNLHRRVHHVPNADRFGERDQTLKIIDGLRFDQ